MQDTLPTSAKGALYIVATPIGNLEDITLRALRVLKEVDYIAAEDTRHTKKLLNHFGIKTKLISYYREKESRRADEIIKLLDDGKTVAIVTDAGTPGISDPGAIVVQKAHQHNHTIIPLPGASALTTALSCAGIGENPILFHGFAPAKKNQRKKLLQSLIHSTNYTIFYESPHRIESFLNDAYELLGDRNIFLARELTKTYEELINTSLKDLIDKLAQRKKRGEYVLIISPAATVPADGLEVDELLLWYRDHSSLSLKDSCKAIAEDLGISKSKIYKKAIQLWDERIDQA